MVAQEFFTQWINLPLPLLVLLVGGIIFPIIGLLSEQLSIGKIREVWMILISMVTLASVYILYNNLEQTSAGIIVLSIWGQSPPLGGCFEIDMLSIFMAGTITFLGVLVSIYSINYMEKEGRLTEFYTLVTFMMAGMTGIAMAGDFFTLFIFWELMSLSSYVLVAFLKSRWGPMEAGFKYLIMSATAGAFLLFSMSLLYGMTGTLNFAYLSIDLKGVETSPWLLSLLSTLIIGFGVKSAIVPLHTWLPDAHPEAPSPISALLSGIVIETGLYALTRVLYLFFDAALFRLPIALLAVITMTLANTTALLQQDIKRMLAYSSIAQIGYMLIGLASGTVYGVMGLFLHVFNHSLMKGLAFLSAGSLVQAAETRDISKLKGIGHAMPVTTLSLFIAMLGLGGVPVTNGFVSKLFLFGSAVGVGMWWLTLIGVLNSAFSMAYYLRVMKTLISEPAASLDGLKEAPVLMLGITAMMAVLIVVFGVWPGPVIAFARSASEALVTGLDKYIGMVFP